MFELRDGELYSNGIPLDTWSESRRRVNDLKKSYDQLVNRLWAGNSAGALSVIGVIGSGHLHDSKLLPFVLGSFLFGLMALGFGSITSLWYQRAIARAWEECDGDLGKLTLKHIKRPTKEVFQTIPTLFATIASAIFFLIAVGLVVWLVGILSFTPAQTP